MKLDVKTLEILKNFYSINPSLVVKEGNILTTISTNKTVLAKATVPDVFPKRFAMYNLGRFINSVTSYEEAELTFNDKHLVIQDAAKGEQTILSYGDEAGIRVPPEKQLVLSSVDASCKITTANVRAVQKQLGILNVPEIAVVGDGTNVYLQAVDSKEITSDVFSITIGTTDKTFRSIFKAENIKLMPSNYDVDICSRGISHFRGENIEYWIAVEANSTYS
jgi:hypothetical protein